MKTYKITIEVFIEINEEDIDDDFEYLTESVEDVIYDATDGASFITYHYEEVEDE